jgi:hypothetical protein
MKNKFIFLTTIALLFGTDMFAQINKIIIEDDISIRQSLSAKYLKENFYEYKTAEAKSYHNILLSVFVEKTKIVNFNLDKISDQDDKKNIISFIEGLNSLLIITPSWEDIIRLEKERLLFEDRAASRTPHLLENKTN